MARSGRGMLTRQRSDTSAFIHSHKTVKLSLPQRLQCQEDWAPRPDAASELFFQVTSLQHLGVSRLAIRILIPRAGAGGAHTEAGGILPCLAIAPRQLLVKRGDGRTLVLWQKT